MGIYGYTAKEKQVMQAEKRRLASMRVSCKKILLVYKIRLQCLHRRHELLSQIGHDFNNITKSSFYQNLKANLERERKLLHFLRREDLYVEGSFLHTLKVLKKYKEYYNPSNMESRYKGMYASYPYLRELEHMNWGRIQSTLVDMVKFTNLMQADLSKIERRMEKEELFLKAENRNPAYFKEFILEWDDEVKGNRNLIKHFKQVLKRHGQGIIQSGQTTTQEGLDLLAGGMGLQEGDIFELFVAPFVLIEGFFGALVKIFEKEVTEDEGDRKLLQKIEQIKGIKRPFWKKAFA
jgi:hypothetical protein|tara:strand:- start:73 stop:951 length:879 start_codon:yes stop_codon:yes gene_type:complete